MNESLEVYNDSAILNRASEFSVTLVWTETSILMYILNGCKNDVTPFFCQQDKAACDI